MFNSRGIKLKMLIVTMSIISTTSACGIFGWDPLGICLRDDSLIYLPDDILKQAINGVMDFYTDEVFRQVYSDFTTTGMELQIHNKTQFDEIFTKTKKLMSLQLKDI